MRMYDLPDARGHFGPYGGVFVAETLSAALEELRAAYARARKDPAFQAELRSELKHYVGRPTPVYHAKRLTGRCGGAQIYIKREDLNHTGAHKINNVIGQALLARRAGWLGVALLVAWLAPAAVRLDRAFDPAAQRGQRRRRKPARAERSPHHGRTRA